MSIKDVAEIVAILVSLLVGVAAYLKTPAERRKTDAEADNLHEDAADKAARRYIDAVDRVERLEKITTDQQTLISELTRKDRERADLIASLEQDRAQLRERQDALESENRCLKADNEAMRLQVSKLRERQDALESENRSLRAENAQQRNEMSSLQERVIVFEADNAELRELVSKLTAQVAEMGGEPVKPKRAGGRHER
jgi:chromosome segregation ATPase